MNAHVLLGNMLEHGSMDVPSHLPFHCKAITTTSPMILPINYQTTLNVALNGHSSLLLQFHKNIKNCITLKQEARNSLRLQAFEDTNNTSSLFLQSPNILDPQLPYTIPRIISKLPTETSVSRIP